MAINQQRVQEACVLVDHYIAEQQRLRLIAGVVVAVGIGAEPVLLRAYGQANVERNEVLTPSHVFRIASHSKMFTSVACMTLVQQGKMRLDDALGQYVDGVSTSIGRATIRQLLNHTAGVIRDGLDANYWQLDRVFPDRPGLIEIAREILTPNDFFKYSNIGYSLVGLAVAAVAGKPYNEYVQEAILEPLGMKHSGADTDQGTPDRLTTGYTGRAFPFGRLAIPDVPTYAMSPATGFYATAEDLLRFAAANHFGNEKILTDASKREMQQPYWEVRNSDERYGLGFCTVKVGDRQLAGHGGSFPGHATRTWWDAKEGLTVVVLINETGGPSAALGRVTFRILDKALKSTESGSEGTDLDRFTGQFVGLWGTVEIVRFGGELYQTSPSVDDPVAAPARLQVVDKNTLRITETGGYGSPNELVRFIRDESGRIVEVVSGGESSYPTAIMADRIRSGIVAPS